LNKEEKTGLLSLIPEIYYDVIARVTPGAIFLLGLTIIKYPCLIQDLNNILNIIKDMKVGAASVSVLGFVFFIF